VDIKAELRQYLTEHHLAPGEAAEVADATPLVAYGILDSLAVMQLVMFLEGRFGIEFTPRDLDRRSLESIEQIESLVRRKLAQAADPGPHGAAR
jgi:acyl carrier protein